MVPIKNMISKDKKLKKMIKLIKHLLKMKIY